MEKRGGSDCAGGTAGGSGAGAGGAAAGAATGSGGAEGTTMAWAIASGGPLAVFRSGCLCLPLGLVTGIVGAERIREEKRADQLRGLQAVEISRTDHLRHGARSVDAVQQRAIPGAQLEARNDGIQGLDRRRESRRGRFPQRTQALLVVEIAQALQQKWFDLARVPGHLFQSLGDRFEFTSGRGPLHATQHLLPDLLQKRVIDLFQAQIAECDCDFAETELLAAEHTLGHTVDDRRVLIGAEHTLPHQNASESLAQGTLLREDRDALLDVDERADTLGAHFKHAGALEAVDGQQAMNEGRVVVPDVGRWFRQQQPL
jgi:hypothetical protein